MEESTSPPQSTAIVNPAPFVINGTDRAGLIVVVTTFCLVSIWVLFAIRVYIRTKINGPWKLDDTCVAIATTLSTARSAVVYVAVHHGQGKSIELLQPGADYTIGKYILADIIIYFIALGFSKAAVLLLCQRMTPKREHWYAMGATLGLVVAWIMASSLLVSVKCSPSNSWSDFGQCVNITARWKAICTVDIITELLLFCCLLYLVIGLHMSWPLKALVIVAFGIRLPTSVFSGLHLRSLLREVTASDPTLAAAVTLAWRQFELDFAIIACTFSSLGAFLKPFNKELGPSRSGSMPLSGNRYPMNSLGASGNHSGNHSKKDARRASQVSLHLPILRPDPGVNTTTATFGRAASDTLSVESNDSKKGIIMKKQWVVNSDSQ